MSAIPSSLRSKMEESLVFKKGNNISILDIVPVSGGCINNTSKILTNEGSYFLKWNIDCDKNMFDLEKKGLDMLGSAQSIQTPQIISIESEYLLMDFIETVNVNTSSWEEAGRAIAELHQISSKSFGLDYNNFIGTLIQDNQQKDMWVDFYINQRIYPQLLSGNFPLSTIHLFEKFFINVEKFFPEECPSLLHGDFWQGNFLMSTDGIFLIDPAIYFGFREMDIAMTKLFGGFNNRFYEAYHEHFPLAEGWEERVDICNLYPLLVHANLFGGSYHSQLISIVKRFV